jgi:hypothetical protein
MSNKEKKAARPKMDRDRWLSLRNTRNVGQFFASRAKFLHVSQWYEPIYVGNRIAGFAPQYVRNGKPVGHTYKKEVQA